MHAGPVFLSLLSVHIYTLDRISCVLLGAGGKILDINDLRGGVT